jgi:hypothetical protein
MRNTAHIVVQARYKMSGKCNNNNKLAQFSNQKQYINLETYKKSVQAVFNVVYQLQWYHLR